jgi:hypothetical protein
MSVSSFITINKLSIVGLNMRLLQLKNQYLYEGLDRESRNTVMLWESAGIKLREAQLTADQIQQLFAEVEKGATAGGSNRTMLGKGKDATVAIKKAYDDLVTKVQSSGPVKGADAMYDSAVAKIEAGLGGPDNAVNQVIQKYRKFAKENPVAQSLIYSILIAAAGISGVGLGGAAVLGLLKMTDKLLQGEKFSTAVGKGLATGALAYGAGQIGQALKGTPTDVASTGSDLSNRILDQSLENPAGRFAARQAVADALKSGDIGSSQAKELIKQIGSAATNPEAAEQAITQALQNAGSSAASNAASSAADVSNLAGKALRQEVEAIALKAAKDAIAGGIDPSSVNTIAGTVQGSIDQFGSAAGGKLSQMSIDGIARKAAMVAGRAAEAAAESITRSGKHLSEGQVYLVFNRICATNDRLLAEGVLREGPMDFFKGAAAKGMDKLKTVGKNLTTKVTADKLNSAWRKAGAPADSEELKSFLQSQGVDQTVVDTVYSSLKIKSQPVKSAAGATDKTKAAVSPTTDVPAGAEQSAATQTLYAQLKKDVMGLNKKEKQRIFAYLQKQLGTV